MRNSFNPGAFFYRGTECRLLRESSTRLEVWSCKSAIPTKFPHFLHNINSTNGSVRSRIMPQPPLASGSTDMMSLAIIFLATLFGFSAAPWWTIFGCGLVLAAIESFGPEAPRSNSQSAAIAYAVDAFRFVSIVRGLVAASVAYGLGNLIGWVLLNVLKGPI